MVPEKDALIRRRLIPRTAGVLDVSADNPACRRCRRAPAHGARLPLRPPHTHIRDTHTAEPGSRQPQNFSFGAKEGATDGATGDPNVATITLSAAMGAATYTSSALSQIGSLEGVQQATASLLGAARSRARSVSHRRRTPTRHRPAHRAVTRQPWGSSLGDASTVDGTSRGPSSFDVNSHPSSFGPGGLRPDVWRPKLARSCRNTMGNHRGRSSAPPG